MNPQQEAKVVSGMLAMTLVLLVVAGAIMWQYTDLEGVVVSDPQDPQHQVAEEFSVGFVSGTEYRPGQLGQVVVEAKYRNESSAIVPTVEEIYIGSLTASPYNDTWDRPPSVSFNAGWYTSAYLFARGVNTQSPTGICDWETRYSFTGWTCFQGYNVGGGTGPETLQRTLDSGQIVVGFGANVTVSQYETDGGAMYPTFAAMVVGDHGDSWRFVGYDEDELGPYDGVTLELGHMRLYERIGGQTTLLASLPDPMCDSNGCSRNAAKPRRHYELYIDNGDAVVTRDGIEIGREGTRYRPSNITTYGIYGHSYDDLFSLNMHMADQYDIINATAPEYYNLSNCVASVWYPNKTLYIQDEQMRLHMDSENAYVEFEVPGIDGVYEYQAECTVDGVAKRISKSFHVTKQRIRAEVMK